MWRAIEHGDDAPYELVLSQICEEFHCLPSRAQWELEHDPDLWVLRLMPVRAFVRTKQALDAATTPEQRDKFPPSRMKDLVEGFEFEEAREILRRKRQGV